MRTSSGLWCVWLLLGNKESYVQSLIHVWLFAAPWTAAHQASLSITNSQSLLRLTSIESVVPSNHLILCCPILLLPSVFPNIRVFSSESVLCIRWPQYWSFSFSISPSIESPMVSLTDTQALTYTHVSTHPFWKLEMLTLVYVWSLFTPREDFLNLAHHSGLPGWGRERGKFLPDHCCQAWCWVLWAWLVGEWALSLFWLLPRQPLGLPAGLPCQRPPSGSPRTQAMPLLLSATVLSTFCFPFRLSLWASLTLSVKPWWVESVSRRARLTFLVPFNLPSGEGASSHFLLLCHLVSLQPPPTLWFLGWVSHTSPQTQGDTYQALHVLPLKLLSPDFRWKVYAYHPTHLREGGNRALARNQPHKILPSLSTVLNLFISSLWTFEPARSTS